jgi:hypothetical protein
VSRGTCPRGEPFEIPALFAGCEKKRRATVGAEQRLVEAVVDNARLLEFPIVAAIATTHRQAKRVAETLSQKSQLADRNPKPRSAIATDAVDRCRRVDVAIE